MFDVYIKIMNQEILRKEYDTTTQDNLATINSFFSCGIERGLYFKKNNKITKQYQKVKGIMLMND